MKLRFAKMHGIGNDFMVLDLVTQNVELTADRIKRWSDRRTGVGFDQLLAVLPPSDPTADFRYRIFNRDGTQAEQCGNGARCFAKFVRDHGLSVKQGLTLETSSGLVRTRMLEDDRVEVEMGVPGLEPGNVPFRPELAEALAGGVRFRLPVADGEVVVAPVSIGNPHAVIEVDDIVNAPVKRLGVQVQASRSLPGRRKRGVPADRRAGLRAASGLRTRRRGDPRLRQRRLRGHGRGQIDGTARVPRDRFAAGRRSATPLARGGRERHHDGARGADLRGPDPGLIAWAKSRRPDASPRVVTV